MNNIRKAAAQMAREKDKNKSPYILEMKKGPLEKIKESWLLTFGNLPKIEEEEKAPPKELTDEGKTAVEKKAGIKKPDMSPYANDPRPSAWTKENNIFLPDNQNKRFPQYGGYTPRQLYAAQNNRLMPIFAMENGKTVRIEGPEIPKTAEELKNFSPLEKSMFKDLEKDNAISDRERKKNK